MILILLYCQWKLIPKGRLSFRFLRLFTAAAHANVFFLKYYISISREEKQKALRRTNHRSASFMISLSLDISQAVVPTLQHCSWLMPHGGRLAVAMRKGTLLLRSLSTFCSYWALCGVRKIVLGFCKKTEPDVVIVNILRPLSFRFMKSLVHP